MEHPTRQFILFSTRINRALFEGEIDKALLLIGHYMQENRITASIEALAAIPVEHHRTGESPLVS
ncbi:hypothetical protein [Stappia indica]|uniref:hypothetical protein n=1 Tax=Stappia indica TaxID=538381 RepID=UPI001CD26ADF|nr:hypothetical protein [Stappia indica]MCA1298440.1 hypothetical protein [Stappia indica]